MQADLIGRGERAAERSPDALLRKISDDVSEAVAYVTAHSNTVRDVMSTNVVTISEDASLQQVAQLMLQRRVKRLPVLRGSQLVGVVSRINLVQALLAVGGQRPAGLPVRSAVAAPAGGSAAAPAPATDEQLEAAVDQAIKVHRWSSARVDVTVLKGIAHLWGIVADAAIRRAYLVSIEKVPGIKDIIDHTHVIPPHPVSR